MIKTKEDQILSFLKKKYKPEVVVLVGSRARNEETEGSDWDFVIYTNLKKKGGCVSFLDENLDITIEPAMYSETTILKNSFSPIFSDSLRVLLDNSDAKFGSLLERTNVAYAKGPFKLWKNDHEDRIKTLHRLVDKIARYENMPEVQFIYTGAFYEFAQQVYFEAKDVWTPAPKKIFTYLKDNDKKLFSLFQKLRTSEGIISTQSAKEILEHILNSRS